MRLLVRKIEMPSIEFTTFPFSSQVMSTGKSPLLTVHVIEAASPEFMGLSLNSKGVICGGTIKNGIASLSFLYKDRIK